ncbi:glutamine--fructose-6-phosphate transaminase (isomerizing) [Mollicutes bacterium LVI A0078]|nr:glutamine--fructose-6-phosphate transaminase (isomerizing) [Mollicutes bacterium LVI A0075]WOO90813.1 glutamine--fructose-6-phosphate transaminase (isomerizing) [Mollicutes bacterium LVI A0078]
MCGIVGTITSNQANDIVLEGLKRLEYRGYDSCGITYEVDGKLKVVKSIERIKDLREQVTVGANVSFGHTRWATHGGVNLENAHPHITVDGKMGIVHNGVIENFEQLREEYCNSEELKSETDTEVILYTLYHFYKLTNDMKSAINEFMNVVHGSYALIVYLTDTPNVVYTLKNKSPLLIGKNDGIITISSDPSAVIDRVTDFYQMEDKKYALINTEDYSIELFEQDGTSIDLVLETIDMEYEEVSTQEYDTFMEKEIEEQPKAMRNIVENYKTLGFDNKLVDTLKSSKRIYIVASGTSYNAGLISKDIIETKLQIPVEVVLGSEFGYANNIISEGSFFIFLSQSGETADSMLVFNQVKEKYPILAITNVRGSQMDRNADFSLNIFAGQEVAVASTKAYTAQIAVVAMLAYTIADDTTIYEQLLEIANDQERVIADKLLFDDVASHLKDFREVFYLGRLQDYALCEEASLKIKEISYINVSSFAAGELKHGTISLIDDSKLTVALVNDPKVAENTRSNVQEVRARDGEVLIFSTTDTARDGDKYVVHVSCDTILKPLVTILPQQYLALYTATQLGLDVDKPRNLAKAVTVE